MSFWTNLRDDESGAALIEYTTLIGILVVAVILLIVAVGLWTAGIWQSFLGLAP